MGIIELSVILLNSMLNRCSKQVYVQGFDCQTISFKKSENMSEHMEIAEIIYEHVVTPSY